MLLTADDDDDDDDECGAVGGMIGRGNRRILRKPAPVSLSPPQIPYVNQARTRAATVGIGRLTAKG
jgi:hypothetical protein